MSTWNYEAKQLQASFDSSFASVQGRVALPPRLRVMSQDLRPNRLPFDVRIVAALTPDEQYKTTLSAMELTPADEPTRRTLSLHVESHGIIPITLINADYIKEQGAGGQMRVQCELLYPPMIMSEGDARFVRALGLGALLDRDDVQLSVDAPAAIFTPKASEVAALAAIPDVTFNYPG